MCRVQAVNTNLDGSTPCATTHVFSILLQQVHIHVRRTTYKRHSTSNRQDMIVCLLQNSTSDNLELIILTILQYDYFSFPLSISVLSPSTSLSDMILDHIWHSAEMQNKQSEQFARTLRHTDPTSFKKEQLRKHSHQATKKLRKYSEASTKKK